MIFDRWQAPDRDSPTTVGFEFKVEIGTQLDAIMRAEGKRGTLDGVVKTSSGDNLSRPRRWHKMFERMGLLYPDSDGNTQLTDLGLTIRSAQKNAAKEYRRLLAKQAISVLRKYQLRNPADILDGGRYPDHCDIHPYWALWKAAIELDGKLHWDELNRELMWVLKHSDLDAAISKIRRARLEPGYDPVTGGGPVTRLRERAYDQSSAPDDRDPSGQVRDQKTTPWFKRAGLGELLMVMPGRTGGGYWKIHDDIIDLLAQEVKSAPVYNAFETDQEWFSYFGTAESLNSSYESETHEPTVIESCKHLYELVLERHNVVFYGPPGTGKTHASLNLASEWERINGAGSVFKVTFHPSYGYEDFVQGYRPKSDNPSLFSLKNGIFLVAADQARKIEIENKKVLLVIDEINRGDISRIFGELITYIESDKRGIRCFLAQQPEADFYVPQNIYFLGTMNTADKSISLLDVAMRRRFAFVDFPPDSTAFENISTWADSVCGIPLGDILNQLNDKLSESGIESDRSIGQALLKVDASEDAPISSLRKRFEFDIIPLISEYCYLDKHRVQRVLGGLVNTDGKFPHKSDSDFMQALREWLGINDAATFSNDWLAEGDLTKSSYESSEI